jgi:Fungal tRNA ligase phosphodiesterase domain
VGLTTHTAASYTANTTHLIQDLTRDLERIAFNPPNISTATSSPRHNPSKSPIPVQPFEHEASSSSSAAAAAVPAIDSSHYYSVQVDAQQLQQALGVHACSALQHWLHARWGLKWDIESAIGGSSSSPAAPHITLLFVDPEQTTGTYTYLHMCPCIQSACALIVRAVAVHVACLHYDMRHNAFVRSQCTWRYLLTTCIAVKMHGIAGENISSSSSSMAAQLHSCIGHTAAFTVAGAACDGQAAALVIKDLKLVREDAAGTVEDADTEPDTLSSTAAAATVVAAIGAHSNVLPCANECPHITLCTAQGVAPRHSNAMLQSGAYEFMQLNFSGVQLTGTVALRLRDIRR